MRALAGLIISAIASVLVGGSALAAELVMFEDPACPYCRRWHAEVGVSYHATEEGRIAPLRRVDIKDRYKAGVSLKGPVTFTPTFVLAEDGREVGRIVGYSGADFFYGFLANLLEQRASSPARTRGLSR
ncbi:MAG TPA: thioredoxin family protein [Hyphomicrobiaceae bacterium]|jgi:hypothetical protein